MSGHAVTEIEEIWHALEPPYTDLFLWLTGSGTRPDAGGKPVFRPLMLAHAIEDQDWASFAPEDFAAEWKWDGIRVQVAASGGLTRLYSRAGEDVSGAFPDIVESIDFEGVFDGELLVRRDTAVAPFNDLQQRLNRKTVSPKIVADYPAFVRLYDILFDDGEDLRGLPFDERRARLEAWYARRPRRRRRSRARPAIPSSRRRSGWPRGRRASRAWMRNA